MFEVSVQASFSAAHQLRGYKGRPVGQASKCENMHGHNWKIRIFVSAKKLNKQGMVVDFTDLKNSLNRVLSGLDHKNLNNIPYFRKINPTSENIAKYIHKALDKKLLTVSVWETDTFCARYSGSE